MTVEMLMSSIDRLSTQMGHLQGLDMSQLRSSAATMPAGFGQTREAALSEQRISLLN